LAEHAEIPIAFLVYATLEVRLDWRREIPR
jgi:hypothetical protein